MSRNSETERGGCETLSLRNKPCSESPPTFAKMHAEVVLSPLLFESALYQGRAITSFYHPCCSLSACSVHDWKLKLTMRPKETSCRCWKVSGPRKSESYSARKQWKPALERFISEHSNDKTPVTASCSLLTKCTQWWLCNPLLVGGFTLYSWDAHHPAHK